MVRAANERTRGFYVGCAAWSLCCCWLIYNDLGSIAFVGGVLLAIYTFGLRDKFDSEETSSAYSVFNNGGKAIPGGFTGDQLDQQLRGGVTNKFNCMGSATSSTSKGEDAPLVTTSDAKIQKKVESDRDTLKRRSAAAAAAERRLKEQQQKL